MKRFLILAMLASLFPAVLSARSALAMTAQELGALYSPYTGDSTMALDQPHRTVTEIGSWVSEIVGTVLKFASGNTGRHLTVIRPYFTDQGYAGFAGFLNAQGFGDAIAKQTLGMDATPDAAPTLLGQGASNGAYAWAFEVPLTLVVSSVPGKPPVNRDVTIRIQVTRSPKGADPHGVLIDSWAAFDGVDTFRKTGSGLGQAPLQAPLQAPAQAPAQDSGQPARTP
ncbi:MAG: DotI/IcmL/TraM family protein [Rhodospirillales bacterium]|nr:DotI/IcmL family type IV secretion protein [Alphaproteobacteria bacterium]MCB9986229.1 DotI/IcmL/TraM family protein [Rhodospirillales bacterium]USO07216.1 MAG: DotI/IcmL family type IV secretion protein [Rhodospirillales bacterium]